MFEFFSMAGDYDDRVVARHETESLIVSTCAVNDGDQPYETGVSHPEYADNFVIVEAYGSKETAQEGHDRWVSIMTSEPLPDELIDCVNALIGQLAGSLSEDGVLAYPRKS